MISGADDRAKAGQSIPTQESQSNSPTTMREFIDFPKDTSLSKIAVFFADNSKNSRNISLALNQLLRNLEIAAKNRKRKTKDYPYPMQTVLSPPVRRVICIRSW